ncbi:MAG: hypothetical protein GY792_13265 [Gammaproteobacteria bacterium]|nr:hypothetical protein [Gammaproteobacteria bacterium]
MVKLFFHSTSPTIPGQPYADAPASEGLPGKTIGLSIAAGNIKQFGIYSSCPIGDQPAMDGSFGNACAVLTACNENIVSGSLENGFRVLRDTQAPTIAVLKPGLAKLWKSGAEGLDVKAAVTLQKFGTGLY